MQTCFLRGLRAPYLRSLSARAERDKMAQATFSCPFRAIHLGHAKGKAFRFAFPFGNLIPTGQGGGCGPLPWIHPRGADETASADCAVHLFCTHGATAAGEAECGVFASNTPHFLQSTTIAIDCRLFLVCNDAHPSCWARAAAEREGRCVRLVPDWETFCAKCCSETTARSAAGLHQRFSFSLHRFRGAFLFLLCPREKEMGGRIRSSHKS